MLRLKTGDVPEEVARALKRIGVVPRWLSFVTFVLFGLAGLVGSSGSGPVGILITMLTTGTLLLGFSFRCADDARAKRSSTTSMSNLTRSTNPTCLAEGAC